ncbi:ParA family protein [Marinicellulosiphila megalodicopiae]|uniref:ParA family protein n=1 Tax=Marinicellulosiphila megalodicopiae TaxID=2724896 RepID=UPI003BAF2B10
MTILESQPHTFEPESHPLNFLSSAQAKSKPLENNRCKRILIANGKGGCGKTTIATNIVSYFAKQGHNTALIDCDPQASSLHWWKDRNQELPFIYAIDGCKSQGLATKSWLMKQYPIDTRYVVYDTPAGLCGHQLDDLIRQSDLIVIPVAPSAIDIRATTDFIKAVLLSPNLRNSKKRLAVVANRVRKNTLIYGKLEKFLQSLHIDFVTSFRDTQNYVRTSEFGLGIHDLNQTNPNDKLEWDLLINWIDNQA